MSKKLVTFSRILCCIILLFIIFHLTPHMSLRTYLFFTGHPKLAFTSIIKEFDRGTKNKNIKFYTFNPSPVDRATGGDMLAYKSTKVVFLYLSSHQFFSI